MQLYFIRHGQSENNALWARTGSSVGRNEDPPLTDIGEQQAEVLAQFLHRNAEVEDKSRRDYQNVGGFGLTHVYCSPMIRAVQTGSAITRALNLPLVLWMDIHEEGGIYLKNTETEERLGQRGRNRAYFETHYPHLVLPDCLGEEGWWNRPFEAREVRPLRAQRVLKELHARHGNTEDRVAIVSHGGFYNQFLAALLGFPARNGYWFPLNNAAMTRIDFRNEDVEDRDPIAIAYHNRVDFLPKTLIT